jgi:glutamate-1-semialdehyde aminotransferase
MYQAATLSGNPLAMTAGQSDTAAFGRFFRSMLEAGVYLAPSPFQAGSLSASHTDNIIDASVEAARTAFRMALDPPSRARGRAAIGNSFFAVARIAKFCECCS